MAKSLVYVGLDVHKDTIVIARAIGKQRAEVVRKIPNDWGKLLKVLDGLGPKERLRVCYEAGPTGYDLARRLNGTGICCIVVAPSLIPVQAGRRVKTNRHWNWIERQEFAAEAQRRVLADSIRAVKEAAARVERLEKDIAELVESWTLAPLVRALQALRGVGLLTAVISAAVREISEKAEERLSRRYQALVARGKESRKAVMAVARELAGFVWAIAQEVKSAAA